MLENLKNYDSVYESGFTVSGTRQSKDLIRAAALSLDVERRWKLTFGGDRIGYEMEVIHYQKPTYQRPKQRRGIKQIPREDPHADENLWIPLRSKQWGYWGNDLSGNHYEDTVILVSPAGEVTEKGKMHNSSVFGPRDEGPDAPKRVILWSLGRFFSKHLVKVTRVEKSMDGRLVVSALGRMGERETGRWELEIEPAAAWMVRKARFYWDITPHSIRAEMRNDGTVWSGSYCIPKEAIINHWGPIGDEKKSERLKFEPAVEKFDEKLYNNAQQAVAHNQTPTLTLHDYRVSPPVISEPFRPIATLASPAKPSKKWLFFVVNLVLIALVVFLMLWKRRSTHGEAGGT